MAATPAPSAWAMSEPAAVEVGVAVAEPPLVAGMIAVAPSCSCPRWSWCFPWRREFEPNQTRLGAARVPEITTHQLIRLRAALPGFAPTLLKLALGQRAAWPAGAPLLLPV